MKYLYSVVTLGLALTVCGMTWEKMSAETQCMNSTFAVLQSGDPGSFKATKSVEQSCARLARDGDIAEKVMNKAR